MVINTEKKSVTLTCPADMEGEKTLSLDVPAEELLRKNSGIFSAGAAKTAAILAMSSADEALLRRNLEALGFGDILALSFDSDHRDRIGVCLASRIRDNRLEVIAVLRGTSGSEWYSNFDLGYSAEHRGFSKAADYAELRLGDYVFTRAIGMEPVFFLCGYSRGGAVANILAKRLSDRYGTDSVSAYTFAAPATTISRRIARYNNIFNLIRGEDFFTRVPLAGWGYTRYGRDISLSGGDISRLFSQLTGEDYIGFLGQEAVDSFLCAVARLAPNVHAYYERRREVGEQRLSLYEFMTGIADMLSNHMDDAAADTFMSAMVSDYADLMSFLSSGADLMELLSTTGVPRCSIADAHSPAAYIAALELYFTN